MVCWIYCRNHPIILRSFCFGFSRATISIITYNGYFQEYSFRLNYQNEPLWTLEHEFNLLSPVSDNASSWSNVTQTHLCSKLGKVHTCYHMLSPYIEWMFHLSCFCLISTPAYITNTIDCDWIKRTVAKILLQYTEKPWWTTKTSRNDYATYVDMVTLYCSFG